MGHRRRYLWNGSHGARRGRALRGRARSWLRDWHVLRRLRHRSLDRHPFRLRAVPRRGKQLGIMQGNRLGQFANDAANGLELIRHRPDGASVIFTRLGIDRTHAVLEIDQPPCDDGHPVFDSDEPIRKFSRRSGDPGRIGDDRPRDVPFSASPATGQNEDDGPKSDHCCAGDEPRKTAPEPDRESQCRHHEQAVQGSGNGFACWHC